MESQAGWGSQAGWWGAARLHGTHSWYRRMVPRVGGCPRILVWYPPALAGCTLMLAAAQGGANMKAAILNDYQTPLSLEEVRIDSPKAGEVKVKVAATGVCHSDYHVMKGEWKFGVPVLLGHEASGIVEEVGEGVTGIHPGD